MECKWRRGDDERWRRVELIDTLWNVNCIALSIHLLPDYRINRYIMECKC